MMNKKLIALLVAVATVNATTFAWRGTTRAETSVPADKTYEQSQANDEGLVYGTDASSNNGRGVMYGTNANDNDGRNVNYGTDASDNTGRGVMYGTRAK